MLLAGFAFGTHRAWGLIHIGVAYKAKMLCSGVFVSGRRAADVNADLAVDDLSSLRHIDAHVDHGGVVASLFGVSYKAVYRPGLGCTLVHPDFDIAAKQDAGADSEGGNVGTPPLEISTHPKFNEAMQWAFSEPDQSQMRRTRAVLIMQDGRIVAERYAPGFTADTPLLGWSMSKGAINALVGTLVAQGKLRLADPAAVPAWLGPGDVRRHITIGQLLQMTSGLAFNEDHGNPLQDVTYMLLQAPDMAAYAADKPIRDEPGRAWQYSSGTTNIISGILRRIVGDAPYRTFPRRALIEPLGMRSAVIEPDAAGTFVGSSFMYATARDWATLGQLYLQDGVWNGRRLLPEGWVRYTTTPAPNAPEGAYGAHFWLKIPREYRSSDDLPLPADAFHAVGHEGQFLTIIPSKSLVIVRLGLARYPRAWEHDRFVRLVLRAIDK